MKFKQTGNLGKIDLLQRHLMRKRMDAEEVTLTKEELNEIENQLSKFSHVLSNLNLHANILKNDQYDALVSIIEELMPYYREYKGE